MFEKSLYSDLGWGLFMYFKIEVLDFQIQES